MSDYVDWNWKLKEAPSNIYENPDGMKYYDVLTEKFDPSFSEEQQNIIRQCLEGPEDGLSVETVGLIAYPHIPVSRMIAIYDRLREWNVRYLPVHTYSHPYGRTCGDLTRMDVWKCGQLELPNEKIDALLFLCKNGGFPFKYIKDLENVSFELLREFCELSKYKNEVCKLYKENVSEAIQIENLKRMIERNRRKEKIKHFFEKRS